MNIDHRNPRLRRGFAFVALAAVLGLAAVGLSQCRMVNDTVTGVDLSASGQLKAKSVCVKACNEQYKICKRAAEATYKACKKACGSHNSACRKACEYQYKPAKKACVVQKNLCKKGCYNEGAGTAGR